MKKLFLVAILTSLCSLASAEENVMYGRSYYVVTNTEDELVNLTVEGKPAQVIYDGLKAQVNKGLGFESKSTEAIDCTRHLHAAKRLYTYDCTYTFRADVAIIK